MIPLEYGVSDGPPCFIYSCHIVMSAVISACIPLTWALLSSVTNIYCLDEIRECRDERITPSLAINNICCCWFHVALVLTCCYSSAPTPPA